MSETHCDFCHTLFKDGQPIQYKAVSEYKALKSKIHYAISKPTEILSKQCFPVCYEENNQQK